MKRFQELQLVASTNGTKWVEVEGTMINADIALNILSNVTVDEFFSFDMKQLCKMANNIA